MTCLETNFGSGTLLRYDTNRAWICSGLQLCALAQHPSDALTLALTLTLTLTPYAGPPGSSGFCGDECCMGLCALDARTNFHFCCARSTLPICILRRCPGHGRPCPACIP